MGYTKVTREALIPSAREVKATESDCVAIFSGGLDSTTLVYQLLNDGLTPHLISFNYGQRHFRELTFAGATAHKLGLRWDLVDLTGITHLISNSALTSDYKEAEGNDIIDVPEGHYAEDNMKLTVVPNRNMIMLSIAAGVAVNNSYKFIATGVHAGDHFVYPDCRPTFIYNLARALYEGNQGFAAWDQGGHGTKEDEGGIIRAPFLHASKADIAYQALTLGVPLEDTWSCYKGGEKHCGKCGTCVERLEAIDEAQQKYNGDKVDTGLQAWDKTQYEDKNFWRQAVASR
jgi:7-cyano-7-deazaguanine synthase